MQIITAVKEKSYKKYFEDIRKISKGTLRLLKFVYKALPGYTLTFIITAVFINLIPFVTTWVNSLFIDTLVDSIGNGIDQNLQRFTLLIGAGVLISALNNLINHLSTMAETKIWYGMERDFTLEITKKYAYLDTEHYDNPEMRDLLNKVSQNSNKAQLFVSQIGYMIGDLVTIISAITILVVFSPWIILLMLVTSIPSLVANLVHGRRLWGIWNAKGEKGRDFFWTRHYLTRENSLMELRIFRTREYLLERMNKLHTQFQQAQMEIEESKRVQLFLFSLLRIVGRTGAYIMIALATIAQKITIGQFNFYVSATGRLQMGLGGLVRRFSRMYEYGLYIVDIFEFLDLEEKIISGNICLEENKLPVKVEFKDVSFEYPGREDKEWGIKNLNLTINPGEHIAIVGENGAGKTTLIKLLLRFYDPTKGEILVNEVDLKKIDLDCWYKKIGALFQEFNFYHFTAKENIGVGNPENVEDLEKIIKAAKKSEAHNFIEKYEKEYDQVLDKAFKEGVTPSSGQKQKIALARAFFKDPAILILDEPTSAIDPKAEYEIFERLFEFAAEKTVIIISHRFSTVRNADRILVLEDGRIVEDGSHEELMAIEEGKYKTAFELQRKGYE
ncbi:ATP-binding cassette domain-containing protein [candidate division WWE3 bacterium]|nr:ATP-binding cassette domain-containing protein [candidate division WWE3 bacterium]